MPTYEYKREDGSTFEIIQKISEDALTTCPTTGQKVKRIVSGGGGVLYKGEGWYVTDYKNGGNGKKSGKDDSGSSAEKNDQPSSSDDAKKSDIAKADGKKK